MIRASRRILAIFLALGIIYLLCLLFPQPFFFHRVRRGNIILYTGEEPCSGCPSLLAEVSLLLGRSPLDDTGIVHCVFLCTSLRQFGFFTRGRTALGGLCDNRLTSNIFIHPADLATGHLLTPPGLSGWRDDRPLSYFVAHEITHSLESHYAGRWNVRIPTWLWEGYADYIGMGLDSSFLPLYLSLYRQGSPLMDPSRGLYDRYALYVSYLLDAEHRDIRELLDRPPAKDSVEGAVRRMAFADSTPRPALPLTH